MTPQDFLKVIGEDKTFLVISSRPLDFDCIGSGAVLKKYLESLGKKVTWMFPRKLEQWEKEFYNFLPYFDELEAKDTREILKQKNADVLIFLDGTNLVQFYDSEKDDSNQPQLEIYDKRIHIDHHLQNPEELANTQIKDSKYSSTMELLLTEVVPEKNIDQPSATLGYAAFVGDTGNFKWNFTPRTMELAGYFLAKGADPLPIIDKFFFSKTKTYLKMLAYAINNTLYDKDLGTSFLFLPYEKIREEDINSHQLSEAKEAFSMDVARNVKGYPRGIFMYEEFPKKIYISARGSNLHNKVNMPQMFEELGGNGGGHFNACAMELEGNFEKVKERLLDLLKKYLKESESS